MAALCCWPCSPAVKEFGRALTTRCGAAGGNDRDLHRGPFELDGTTLPSRRADPGHPGPEGSGPPSSRSRPGATISTPTRSRRTSTWPASTDYDAVVTISHQVATTPGVHPSRWTGARPARSTCVHLSWSRIHTEAKIQHANHEVSDPDQAWLLTEFIRYIEDPKAGALDFEDMGPSWASVRNGRGQQTLRANDPETLAVVARFDQLIAFCGMELSRRPGRPCLPAPLQGRARGPGQRDSGLRRRVSPKTVSSPARLLVPNAAVPVEITVDLRANRIDVQATIASADRPSCLRPGSPGCSTSSKLLLPTLQIVANVARMKSPGRSSRALGARSRTQRPSSISPARRHPLVHPHRSARRGNQARPGQGFVRELGDLAGRPASTRTSSSRSRLGPHPHQSQRRHRQQTDDSPSSVLSTTADATQVVEGAPAPAVTNRPELAAPAGWPATTTS